MSRLSLRRTLLSMVGMGLAALAIVVAVPAAQAANLVTVNGKTFDLDQFNDAFVAYRPDGSVSFDGKCWDNFVGVDPLTLGELAAGQYGSDPGDQVSLNDRSTPDWLELNYPSGQTISSATEFVVFEITSSSDGVDVEGLSWKIGFNGAPPIQVTLSEVSHFPSPGGGVEDTNMGVFKLIDDFGFSPGDLLYNVRIENVDSGSGTSDPDFIFGGVTFTPAAPVTTDVCIYSDTSNEICSLDLDDDPGHWEYTDCSGGVAQGIAESLSSTDKGLKVEDKEDQWLFKMVGDYNKGEGKCAHKVDGEEVFKFEGYLEYNPNTACECLEP